MFHTSFLNRLIPHSFLQIIPSRVDCECENEDKDELVGRVCRRFKGVHGWWGIMNREVVCRKD